MHSHPSRAARRDRCSQHGSLDITSVRTRRSNSESGFCSATFELGNLKFSLFLDPARLARISLIRVRDPDSESVSGPTLAAGREGKSLSGSKKVPAFYFCQWSVRKWASTGTPVRRARRGEGPVSRLGRPPHWHAARWQRANHRGCSLQVRGPRIQGRAPSAMPHVALKVTCAWAQLPRGAYGGRRAKAGRLCIE